MTNGSFRVRVGALQLGHFVKRSRTCELRTNEYRGDNAPSRRVDRRSCIGMRGVRGTVVDYRKEQGHAMTFEIEIDREVDGRWIAEVPDLAGVLTYGATREEAVAHVQALALRVIADRLEHDEAPADLLTVTFRAA